MAADAHAILGVQLDVRRQINLGYVDCALADLQGTGLRWLPFRESQMDSNAITLTQQQASALRQQAADLMAESGTMMMNDAYEAAELISQAERLERSIPKRRWTDKA